MWIPDAASKKSRTWHAYRAHRGGGVYEEVVAKELAETIKASWPDGTPPTSEEVRARYGEVMALFESASEGTLTPDGPWKKFSRRLDLGELFLTWEDPDSEGVELSSEASDELPKHEARQVLSGPRILHWRAYFYEPPSCPYDTIVACVHIKRISGDQTNRLQDEHMDQAQARVFWGEQDCWGIDTDPKPLALRTGS